MSDASCPTAFVNAPVGIVWALLVDPVGWGHVFDVRINGLDLPGPGQKNRGQGRPTTLPPETRIFRSFRSMQNAIDSQWT